MASAEEQFKESLEKKLKKDVELAKERRGSAEASTIEEPRRPAENSDGLFVLWNGVPAQRITEEEEKRFREQLDKVSDAFPNRRGRVASSRLGVRKK